MGVPRPDEHLLLGGRRWQVIAVDEDREEVQVQPATGRKPPWFVDDGGIDVDPHIRQKMRELLFERCDPRVLGHSSPKNARRLTKASRAGRLTDRRLDSDRPAKSLMVSVDGQRTMRTLQLICNWANIPAVGRGGLAFLVRMSPDNFVEAIRKVLQDVPARR